MAKLKKRKLSKSGRNENPVGRFARLPHEILQSSAYCSLSSAARVLLIELISMENSHNNGSLWLSIRSAAARMGMSNKTSAANAFDELCRVGLLRLTKDAHFSVKAGDTSRARCWRLTFLHCPGFGRTDEWRAFVPDAADKAARRRMESGLSAHSAYRKGLAKQKFPVLDTGTIKEATDGAEAGAVLNLSTGSSQNDENLPNSVVHDFGPHTAVTIFMHPKGGEMVNYVGVKMHTTFSKGLGSTTVI